MKCPIDHWTGSSIVTSSLVQTTHHEVRNKPLPLTLSDIFLPPEIARSLFTMSFAGDESVLIKSILVHAIEIEFPPQHPWFDSSPCNSDIVAGHQRSASRLRFAGFDLFAELRPALEFNVSHLGFYPPPGTMSDR